MDSRYEKLAEVLIGFSTDLQKGEKILIDAQSIPDEAVVALVREARKRGGIPFVHISHARVGREILRECTEEQLKISNEVEMVRMKQMDAYIALRGADNIFENSDVPSDKMTMAMKAMRPVLNQRVNETKWVVLRWPTPSMAQQALMSTEAFEDFYFKVCTLDYSKMIPGMKALKKAMEDADQVHIVGNGTDLKFSIKGIGAEECGGLRNIPDGEVYSAPVKDSVNGVIQYNTPTVYQGESFENVRLVFEKGKIIEATCSGNDEKLNAILDSDEGARYVGEFAIGFNPYILEPMRDILFDEKIAGSFHFTPGQAYKGPTDNGNKSQVHWDLVNIQRPEHGGGEIYFDGELIRKDGLFIPESLQLLNPDKMLG